jgi:hypothetical protein
MAAIRAFIRDRKNAWVPAALISAAFLFPICLNLILHWPGDFGRYLTFGAHPGGYRPSQILNFMKWHLNPHGDKAWPLSVGCAVIAAASLGATRITGRRRPLNATLLRFSLAVTVLCGFSTAAFGWYVASGSAGPLHYFIGYFFWAVPFALILIIAVTLTEALGEHPGGELRLAGVCCCAAGDPGFGGGIRPRRHW